MEKYKYIDDDKYIMLSYKIQQNDDEQKDQISSDYELPKIDVDPKVRLSALQAISDGSEYFQKKIKAIEKLIDPNNINIKEIDYSELSKLKNYISENLELELQNSNEDCSYLFNLFRFFLDQKWFDLIERLLNYSLDYCTNYGIDTNISFLINLYNFSLTKNNQLIKSKVFSYLKNNKFEQYINDENIELIQDIPDLCSLLESNYNNDSTQILNNRNINELDNRNIDELDNRNIDELDNRNIDELNNRNIDELDKFNDYEKQINSMQELLKHNNLSMNQNISNETLLDKQNKVMGKYNIDIYNENQEQNRQKNQQQNRQQNRQQNQQQNRPPIHNQNKQSMIKSIFKKEKEVLITNCIKPFISSSDSPIRYLKLSNVVYIFGNIEIGVISSIADQNQKKLFKVQEDLYPKYDTYLFIHQELVDNNYSNLETFAKIKINKKGEFTYISNDLINWNNNKIKLYFDSKCYVCN